MSTANTNWINIINVISRSGISKKTGLPWTMHFAQCVLVALDGELKIGKLLLPKALNDTQPGEYLASFQLDVNYETDVVPVITALHPFTGNASPRSNAASQAASATTTKTVAAAHS